MWTENNIHRRKWDYRYLGLSVVRITGTTFWGQSRSVSSVDQILQLCWRLQWWLVTLIAVLLSLRKILALEDHKPIYKSSSHDLQTSVLVLDSSSLDHKVLKNCWLLRTLYTAKTVCYVWSHDFINSITGTVHEVTVKNGLLTEYWCQFQFYVYVNY